MTAPVQKGGQAFSFGFQGYTYSGVQMEDVDVTPEADVEKIAGDNGETVAKIYKDPRVTISLNGLVKDAALTAVKAIKIGDAVTINSVVYGCDKSSCKWSRGIGKWSFAGTKEDSMTYT